MGYKSSQDEFWSAIAGLNSIKDRVSIPAAWSVPTKMNSSNSTLAFGSQSSMKTSTNSAQTLKTKESLRQMKKEVDYSKHEKESQLALNENVSLTMINEGDLITAMSHDKDDKLMLEHLTVPEIVNLEENQNNEKSHIMKEISKEKVKNGLSFKNLLSRKDKPNTNNTKNQSATAITSATSNSNNNNTATTATTEAPIVHHTISAIPNNLLLLSQSSSLMASSLRNPKPLPLVDERPPPTKPSHVLSASASTNLTDPPKNVRLRGFPTFIRRAKNIRETPSNGKREGKNDPESQTKFEMMMDDIPNSSVNDLDYNNNLPSSMISISTSSFVPPPHPPTPLFSSETTPHDINQFTPSHSISRSSPPSPPLPSVVTPFHPYSSSPASSTMTATTIDPSTSPKSSSLRDSAQSFTDISRPPPPPTTDPPPPSNLNNKISYDTLVRVQEVVRGVQAAGLKVKKVTVSSTPSSSTSTLTSSYSSSSFNTGKRKPTIGTVMVRRPITQKSCTNSSSSLSSVERLPELPTSSSESKLSMKSTYSNSDKKQNMNGPFSNLNSSHGTKDIIHEIDSRNSSSSESSSVRYVSLSRVNKSQIQKEDKGKMSSFKSHGTMSHGTIVTSGIVVSNNSINNSSNNSINNSSNNGSNNSSLESNRDGSKRRKSTSLRNTDIKPGSVVIQKRS